VTASAATAHTDMLSEQHDGEESSEHGDRKPIAVTSPMGSMASAWKNDSIETKLNTTRIP
jgi:hypothetical protein